MKNSSSQESPPYAGYRILVADDNAINGRIAKRLLEMFGCEVDLASSGQETLSLHARQPYDLILLDCQMPDLDGYQACSQLRQAEQGSRRVPIIGWTVNADRDEIEQCRAAGMDDCLSKQLHVESLARMLATWLKPRQSAYAASHPADLSGLEAMHRISGDGFAELVELFEKDMPQRFLDLQQAIQAADYPAAARTAHMMSGCCASIGALHLSDLCQDLEMQAKNQRQSLLQTQLAAVEAAYAHILLTLHAMLDSPASPGPSRRAS